MNPNSFGPSLGPDPNLNTQQPFRPTQQQFRPQQQQQGVEPNFARQPYPSGPFPADKKQIPSQQQPPFIQQKMGPTGPFGSPTENTQIRPPMGVRPDFGAPNQPSPISHFAQYSEQKMNGIMPNRNTQAALPVANNQVQPPFNQPAQQPFASPMQAHLGRPMPAYPQQQMNMQPRQQQPVNSPQQQFVQPQQPQQLFMQQPQMMHPQQHQQSPQQQSQQPIQLMPMQPVGMQPGSLQPPTFHKPGGMPRYHE